MKCANCHKPTERNVFVYNALSCSEECDQDLSDMLDGVAMEEIYARGRSTDCSIVKRCEHCQPNECLFA